MKNKKNSTALIETHRPNLANKLLIASMCAWLSGKSVRTKIRGSLSEVKSIADVLAATKNFHDEINRSNATLESVMRKLKEKQEKTAEFERVVGVPWPL